MTKIIAYLSVRCLVTMELIERLEKKLRAFIPIYSNPLKTSWHEVRYSEHIQLTSCVKHSNPKVLQFCGRQPKPSTTEWFYFRVKTKQKTTIKYHKETKRTGQSALGTPARRMPACVWARDDAVLNSAVTTAWQQQQQGRGTSAFQRGFRWWQLDTFCY